MDALNERSSVVCVGQQLFGHCLVEVRPLKALLFWRSCAVTLPPKWLVAKAIYILRLAVKGECDQRIVHPFARQHTPDRRSVSVEVPLPYRLNLGPVHLHPLPIVQVFGDRADRLDPHNRNRAASAIEGQTVLSRVRRFDGDPLSRAHGTHHIEELVVVSVLPNSFCKKSRHLIICTAIARANEPICLRACAVCFCIHVCPQRVARKATNWLLGPSDRRSRFGQFDTT